MENNSWNYDRLRVLLKEEPLPAMLVDLDTLEENARRFRDWAQASGKRIRLATKSVRVPDLIRVILAAGSPVFQGLMCYSAREAAFLGDLGFDDLLVAYPSVQSVDIEALHSLSVRGKKVSIVVDSIEHVDRIEKILQAVSKGARLAVCIEVDLSYRALGSLHIGVQRSPIRDLNGFTRLHDRILSSDRVRLNGVMAYEAQVAGVPDKVPGAGVMNFAKRLMKAASRREIRMRRAEIAAFLQSRGTKIDFFNGGGSGSFRSTLEETCLTEVTAGSGILQSQLFDYFEANASLPAFAFALPVSRRPEAGVVTCQSGGFIASGEIGREKQPTVFLPAGLEPLSLEGFGEVQTPLRGAAADGLGLGDPIFCRPAKAGEIGERFPDYLLLRKGAIVGRAPTYRGLGHCFF